MWKLGDDLYERFPVIVGIYIPTKIWSPDDIDLGGVDIVVYVDEDDELEASDVTQWCNEWFYKNAPAIDYVGVVQIVRPL